MSPYQTKRDSPTSLKQRAARPQCLAIVKVLVAGLMTGALGACLPEFPNLTGELINGSEVETLQAETQAVTVRSPGHFKAVFFHVNTHMRQCLVDKPDVYRGYILDSLLDEENNKGELSTLREKMGFGIRAETYVLFQAVADGTVVTIHTREQFQLEKWYKWIAGERGCFPELMG